MVRQVNTEEYMSGPRSIPLNQKYHYSVFIRDTIKRKLLPWRRPKNEELNHVYNQLLNYFAATAESDEQFLRERAEIRRTWSRMCKIMRKCPGLIKFMKEYGVHSRFFYPFLLDIPKGVAMLPAYFKARDIFGNICSIPFSDAMYQFCVHDHVFQSVRFRTEYEQRFLKKALRPLILGPGTLPQLWYNDYRSEVSKQKIDAYDPDSDLRVSLEQIFDGDLKNHGVNYSFDSFKAAFEDERHWHQHDLITSMGLLSYFLNDIDCFLQGAKQCLTSNGVLLLDLQLRDPALIFDYLVLCWRTESRMILCKDVNDALSRMQAACRRHGLSIDEYLAAPNGAGIVFKISKR